MCVKSVPVVRNYHFFENVAFIFASDTITGMPKNAYATQTTDSTSDDCQGRRRADSLVKAFPVFATSLGPSRPMNSMLRLKSSTAFPNHMRTTRNAVMPMKKPRKPIQAEIRWNMGFSRDAAIFSPNLWRKEINVKVKKNIMEKTRATAMNAGDPAGGESSSSVGAPLGMTERSNRIVQ